MKLWHKIAIGGGIAAVGIGALAYEKFKKTKKVLDSLGYFPKISNLNLSWSRIKFDLRIAIQNLSNEDFYISTGGLVKLSKVIVYNLQGQVLATLIVNDLYKIYVPAFGNSETPKITIEMPLTDFLSFMRNLNFSNINAQNIASQLQYGFEIKTFYGESYTYTTFK